MVFICNLNASCPDGEIGKRCGLRSRWSNILESSSLSSGTINKLIKVFVN